MAVVICMCLLLGRRDEHLKFGRTAGSPGYDRDPLVAESVTFCGVSVCAAQGFANASLVVPEAPNCEAFSQGQGKILLWLISFCLEVEF